LGGFGGQETQINGHFGRNFLTSLKGIGWFLLNWGKIPGRGSNFSLGPQKKGEKQGRKTSLLLWSGGNSLWNGIDWRGFNLIRNFKGGSLGRILFLVAEKEGNPKTLNWKVSHGRGFRETLEKGLP